MDCRGEAIIVDPNDRTAIAVVPRIPGITPMPAGRSASFILAKLGSNNGMGL